MRRIKVLLFTLIASISTIYGQTGSISGTLLDSESSETLIAVTVQIESLGIGTTSEIDGSFLLKDVPVGNQKLTISYLGYADIIREVTVIAGQTIDLGTINMEQAAIGLDEVEIFSKVGIDRKTPIAMSSLSTQVIQERFSGAALPDMVQSTPGIYTIQGAGGYGDNEVYIRGFDQTNVAFLINGVPVNDMENGRMFWSNFAGLSEITRNMQVQRGLGASKLAINSIGGTINMITKPADRGEGGRIEFQSGTGSWNNRLRFSYNSGLSDNGWAVSFQGSRTTTNGGLLGLPAKQQGSVVPGAFTDAWSYYLAVSKTINPKHTLTFWGFGAPVNRGTAWTPDEKTRAAFNLKEKQQNNALGYYNGELFNARQNKLHKPLMSLNHYWAKDENTTISTSIYLSLASVLSTQPRDTDSGLFFPERRGLSSFSGVDEFQAFSSDNLINWDYLSSLNKDRSRTIEFPNGDTDIPSLTGNASRFYLESRHNDHNWVGLISNIEKRIGSLNLIAGIDLRHYKGKHYAEVFELFGGDFYQTRNRFGDDENVFSPNGVAYKGDRINYDYDGNVDWTAAFVQAEFTKNKIDFFGTASLTSTWYTRVGNFWNSRDIFADNSFGKSPQQNFITTTLKAGVNYRPDNRHNIFFNTGYFTRPPFFRATFLDARYSGEIRQGLVNENVVSIEAGYGYRTGKIRANLNAYFTNWSDRTTEFDLDNGEISTLDDGDRLPIVLTGLRSEHKGIEADFVYNVTPALEINGFVSLGDWAWAENGSQEVTVTNGGTTVTETLEVDLKGLPPSTAAQTTAGIGVHFRGIKSMYIGGRLNFVDDVSVRYSPEDIIKGFITQDIIKSGFDSYSQVSIYAGRYFDLGDNLSGRLSVSVNNLLGTEYVRWGSYFFGDTQLSYGYPRTFTIGLSIDF